MGLAVTPAATEAQYNNACQSHFEHAPKTELALTFVEFL